MLATLSQTIRMHDGFTPVLRNMQQAMNLTLIGFEKMQQATNNSMNIREFEIAKQKICEVGNGIQQAEQHQRQLNNTTQNYKQHLDRVSFEPWKQSIITLNQGLDLTRRILGGIAGFMNKSDQSVAIDTRIGMVNDGLQSTYMLQQKILALSNDTRAGYEETVNLMNNLTLSQAFKDSKQVLGFTELINKTIRASGATAAQSNAAILQLSQSLGSGLLQGDELKSLKENAPMLLSVLADGLGVAMGDLKDLGAAGELTTARIIEAFESQSARVNEIFNEMPISWSDNMNILNNKWLAFIATLNGSEGSLTRLNSKFTDFLNYLGTEAGQQIMNGIGLGIDFIVDGLIYIGDLTSQTAAFFMQNWGVIQPVIIGVGTAIGILTGALVAYNLVTTISSIATSFYGAAQMINAGATFAATAAQWGFNAALFACPITWIVVVIAIFIAALVGLGVWLYNTWKKNDEFAAGLMRGWNNILNFLDFLYIGWINIWNGIQNFFDSFSAAFLLSLQDMVNSAIGMINDFIGLLNKIPGVTIQAVGDVTFGTQAALNAEANRQSRAQDLANVIDNYSNNKVAREQKVLDMLSSREDSRKAETKKQPIEDFNEKLSLWGDNSGGAGVGAGNIDKVGKIEEPVEIASEDLEIMRELAEMQAIQNFVTLTPQIQITTGPVSKDVDIDEIVRRIDETMENEVAASTKEGYDVG